MARSNTLRCGYYGSLARKLFDVNVTLPLVTTSVPGGGIERPGRHRRRPAAPVVIRAENLNRAVRGGHVRIVDGDVRGEDERVDFTTRRHQAVVDEPVAAGTPERAAAEVDDRAADGADRLARILPVENRFPRQIRQRRILDLDMERRHVVVVRRAGITNAAAEAGDADILQRHLDGFRRCRSAECHRTRVAAEADLVVLGAGTIDIGHHRVGHRDVIGAALGIRALDDLDIRARRVRQLGAKNIDVEHAVGAAAMLDLDRVAVAGIA